MPKKMMVIMAVFLALALPALAEETTPQPQPYGYGMGPGMMGPGHGPGMMGPGYGPGMGRGYGPGMMGPGWGARGLSPEEAKLWQEKAAKYQMESLPLRQKLIAKQLEMQALWAQPQVDQARIQALSQEIAGLQAELYKLRDKFLLDCRQKFGGRGWACPGWGGQGWGGPGSGD